MPNRYEREIEEILRNLEQTEPKTGLGQKFGGRLRRNPAPRVSTRSRVSPSFNFSVSEWLLIVAIVMALLAGGYAHFTGQADLISTVLAAIGVICIVLVALSHFVFQPRRPQATRYGNVTITPLRGNPLSNLRTRWHLFMLKMRYKNKRED